MSNEELRTVKKIISNPWDKSNPDVVLVNSPGDKSNPGDQGKTRPLCQRPGKGGPIPALKS